MQVAVFAFANNLEEELMHIAVRRNRKMHIRIVDRSISRQNSLKAKIERSERLAPWVLSVTLATPETALHGLGKCYRDVLLVGSPILRTAPAAATAKILPLRRARTIGHTLNLSDSHRRQIEQIASRHNFSQLDVIRILLHHALTDLPPVFH